MLNKISVVIATLGDGKLLEVINSLNKNEIKPLEILICIPKEYSSKIDNLYIPNVKKIITNKGGQVFQRSVGFTNAIGEFVLQIDDDILIDFQNILMMANQLLKLGKGNCIGPQYYDLNSAKYCYLIPKGVGKLESYLIDYFLGGAKWGISRMGTISKSGVSYGIDINFMKNEIVETEWLAGGCVLHYKHDIITEDFYPFTGKAYCEDIIHSILLKRNGIKLWVTKSAICNLEYIYEFDKDLYNNAKKYVIELLGYPLIYFHISNLYFSTRVSIRKYFRN
jgi:glycosyltransferase involved in cell wall biosynthesis